jgi:hypothetical protein
VSKPFKHAEVVGPFVEPEWSVAVVNGCRVPYIKLVPQKGKDEGRTEVHMDCQVWVINDDELDVVLNMLAACMARAAGFTHCGEDSKPFNPFATRMIGLG